MAKIYFPLLFLLIAYTSTSAAQTYINEEPVAVRGFDGNLMEPFLTRDGAMLFFNDFGGKEEEKDLHYAIAADDGAFDYVGAIGNANTPKVDGAPSMDENGNLFFVSTRSYDKTKSTVHKARFKNGALEGVSLVDGNVSKQKILHYIMDAEISADGDRLYFNDNKWRLFGGGVKTSNLTMAVRQGEDFYRVSNAKDIFEKLNTRILEYAPSLNADETTIFFNRTNIKVVKRGDMSGVGIYVAHRSDRDAPFDAPERINAITGFVEGPTLSPDECFLYYHRRVGDAFRLYKVTRSDCLTRE